MKTGDCAVVDIGSHSLRCMRGYRDESRKWHFYPKHLAATRLGKDLHATGRLSQEGVQSSFDAMARWYTELGSVPVYAVATSAVREASDGVAFVEKIRQCFGWQARIISGTEEAALSFCGATSSIGEKAVAAVLDIGGESSETAAGRSGKILWSHSYPMGAVRFSSADGRMNAEEMLRLQEHCMAAWLPMPVHPDICIGVGGTLTSLAAMELRLDPYDAEKVEGCVVSLKRLTCHIDRIFGMTAEQRRHITGLQPERADIILAGLIVARSFLLYYKIDEIRISEHDLLEGMFYGME